MTQPQPTFRRCQWEGTCPNEAVCLITVWIVRDPARGPGETRRHRLSCEDHIANWIKFYWPRLGRDGSFRVRQTDEYLARRGLPPRQPVSVGGRWADLQSEAEAADGDQVL